MNFFNKLYYWYFGLTPKLIKKYFCDNGENNKIILVYADGRERQAKPKHLKDISVKFQGNNNLLKLHMPFNLKKSSFLFRCDNSVVEIHKPANLNLNIECIGDNSSFSVGKNCYSLDVTAILCGNKIKIGDNCMFSEKILLLDDTHSVLDSNAHEVLNKEKTDIIIGNHCWIGEHVTLLKRANIPDDCIVAYGSIVTKAFTEQHCVIAGNPAKVVKTGITWHSLSPLDYSEEKALEMKV